jgi:hypothetical protein
MTIEPLLNSDSDSGIAPKKSCRGLPRSAAFGAANGYLNPTRIGFLADGALASPTSPNRNRRRWKSHLGAAAATSDESKLNESNKPREAALPA